MAKTKRKSTNSELSQPISNDGDFGPQPTQSAGSYCAPPVERSVRRSYAEKLLDKRWQQKRLGLLEAAGWKCGIFNCKNNDENATLHVHHKVYLRGRNPWEYEDWAYAVLCDSCHKREQARMETCHILLAKYHNLRDVLMAISHLPPQTQESFAEDLVDILVYSRQDMNIDTGLFRALAGFAQRSFCEGLRINEEKRDDK